MNISLENIISDYNNRADFIKTTPLEKNENLSEIFEANIYFKREDLQIVRSYKIRGAYNKIASLTDAEKLKGIVCASAGNHAQGVAYTCNALQIKFSVFMPASTPAQKLAQVKMFGGEFCNIVITGDTFDDAYLAAEKFCAENNQVFIHPFIDEKVITGQAGVAIEILRQLNTTPDYVFLPIGGGGLAAGVCSALKSTSPKTKIIGAEPEGAPSMTKALEAGKVVSLSEIDRFVDGASVKKVGELCFDICKDKLYKTVTVAEGKICSDIIKLYNKDAIIVEPAGVLSVAALDSFKAEIKGKTIVCIISGGNNDITRMEEIKERALLHDQLKHYFIIRFPQRAGALREFLNNVLGPNDDISFFEYTKKSSREKGPALIGIELVDKSDLQKLISRMEKHSIVYEYLNPSGDLFRYLI